MKRQVLLPLVSILVIVGGLFGWSQGAGNSVLLGLDLKGGAEVVLEPVEDTELSGDALDEALDKSVEIIRNRVDGLGVAEPDITRQGNRIVVQLPGVEDQRRALEVVGQTAELRFRPVCAILPAVPIKLDQSNNENSDGVNDGPVGILPTDQDELSVEGPEGSESQTMASTPDGIGCENLGFAPEDALGMENTVADDDEAENPVIFPLLDSEGAPYQRLLLGRTMLTGASLETADASFAGGFEWQVLPVFRSGADGIDLFNAAASACYNRNSKCQTGQLAIVLDGVIESAPTVNTPFFERDQIVISGNFDQNRAEDTALVLKYGSLPLEFGDPTDPTSGSRVRLVSATLGQDSLDAGITAGLVGLALVALYMIAYYKLLGLAAMLSLAVSGTMLWVILSWLSETRSLALTLAGVVGLIVSIGTSLDSNVVYFEHLKEDIRNGRTLRSAVDQSFPIAFKTIFWANLASLIGAAILYFLTVGSVRGFALMLGLASILDLVATYFFLRPVVKLMGMQKAIQDRSWLSGLPSSVEEES
ncbi:MAG: protein translocase subunit SecD [Actinomycetota bacterium]|jgi:preprotein translocase subunit SecD|nr:protein translocase subunit SecD [Actinomycetota bacterium]|tara:strand:- start:254 stop:1855 length:1602 start_codon:yes stop_codon:yes gene_type:complete